MTLGLENCCTCEVYTMRDGVRIPLPACTATVTESECPPVTASIEFAVDDEFWLSESFDWSCEYVYVDRVCIVDGVEERELMFRGAADAPAPISLNAPTFGFSFTDEYGIKGSCPIRTLGGVGYVAEFFAPDLLVEIAESAGFTAKSDWVPPAAYPTLPTSDIVITEATHPGGPMDHPTFAALIAWCDGLGSMFEGVNGQPLSTEEYLYADDQVQFPGGFAPGNPGPWDAADMEAQTPNQGNGIVTVTEESYTIKPTGEICRRVLFDIGGDGAPPAFAGEHFNRCVMCRPPGNITRDIRDSQCLDVASQLKSIAREAGLTIVYDQETGEVCFSNDPGESLPELRLSTLENLCDARLFPASGGYTEICLQGTDESHEWIGIPSECRKKVKRGKVAVGEDGLDAAALAILVGCADPAPACEVIIDPTCTELGLVAGGYTTDVPALHQYATVEIQTVDATGMPCPHPANSRTEHKPIRRRVFQWDDNGDEVITLTVGQPPPSAADMLAALLGGS